jgi:hypothetical protein
MESSKRTRAVLADILELKSLPRRHQSLELFEPVEDDVDGLSGLFYGFFHEESLFVSCHAVLV